MVKYLKGKSNLDRDLKGDVYVESDCEEDSSGAKKETLEAEDENEEKTRAVLIAGSFAACAVLNNVLFFRVNDELPAGNLSSSTVVQTRSHSLPSNRKAQTLAWVTSKKRRWRRHRLLARQRASTFWLA